MPESLSVVAWGPSRLADNEMDEIKVVLTSGERARIVELSPDRAARYLAGRSLVRKLAAEMLHSTWASIIPEANCLECGGDHGALVIRGSDLCVSLAYSGEHAVALAAHGRKVGIDLESGHPTEERQVGFLRSTAFVTLQSWCDYEAVIKADGRGMLIDINDVKISESAGEKRGQVKDSTALYTFVPLEAPAGLVVSAVVEKIQR